MKRQIRKILVAMLMCFLLVVPVSAAQSGSLLLTKVSQPVEVFLVADKQGICLEEFAMAAESLTQADMTRDMAQKFFQCVKEANMSGVLGEPTQNQEVFIPSLSEGWYLVCSKADPAEFAPFLICVPMTIGKKPVYNIQAEPKVDSPETPESSTPITPEPNIPQTGAILWPQYLLLGLGAAAILAGLAEVYRGRERGHE